MPLPEAKTLDELNSKLLEGCREDEARTVAGRAQTVGEGMLIERERLLGLAAEGFEIEVSSFPKVDATGCVKVRTNFYSTPLRPGTRAQAKIYAESVEVWHEGRRIARHERSYSRQQKIFNLEHYLDVLAHKPGALAGSTPLEQWRQAGRWPASYDTLWAKLIQRHDKQAGTQQMIELLQAALADADELRSVAGGGGGAMSARKSSAPNESLAAQFETLAKQAIRERQTPVGYLEALLSAELEERERRTVDRRLREARLPRMKTLEEFDFSETKAVSAPQLTELAEGGYIESSEPILFLGDCGTGKTHLMTGLCVAACLQKRRVRFTTASALVNELVEAKQQMQLSRVLARWSRYELIAIDEVGYVPLAEVGAEFLFQVIADRAEKAALMLTTNLPFSEWTKVIPNARLCKALLDRITDRAHIIETGEESYRFRRTLAKKKRGR